MADAHDSKSCTARCGGSSPLSGTTGHVYNSVNGNEMAHA